MDWFNLWWVKQGKMGEGAVVLLQRRSTTGTLRGGSREGRVPYPFPNPEFILGGSHIVRGTHVAVLSRVMDVGTPPPYPAEHRYNVFFLYDECLHHQEFISKMFSR